MPKWNLKTWRITFPRNRHGVVRGVVLEMLRYDSLEMISEQRLQDDALGQQRVSEVVCRQTDRWREPTIRRWHSFGVAPQLEEVA